MSGVVWMPTFAPKSGLKASAKHLRALVVSFVTTRISEGFSTVKSGRELTSQIVEASPDLDCIYYSNDDLAAGGAFHCISAGLSVPDELMLTGFNGLEFVKSLPVSIATSLTPRREIGQAAARIVLDSASGDQA